MNRSRSLLALAVKRDDRAVFAAVLIPLAFYGATVGAMHCIIMLGWYAA